MVDSFGKQLREDLAQESKPSPEKVDTATISQALGILGSAMTEIIASDIGQMIERDMRKEIDGYVLALSRIMRHDLGWKCIQNAFASKQETVPAKYKSQFNDMTTKPSARFVVE